MRSRRFVALFGGRTADGPGELRGDGNRGGRRGAVVAIVEAVDVGRRDVGGTARHATARATWRETIRANNRQEAPPSWRERGTTVVLNLARRGNNKAEPRSGHHPVPEAFFPEHSAAQYKLAGEITPSDNTNKNNIEECYFSIKLFLLRVSYFIFYISNTLLFKKTVRILREFP